MIIVEDNEIIKYLNEYPYLKDMSEFMIFELKEVINEIRMGKYYDINCEKVYVGLLSRIMNNSKYYNMFIRYLKDEIRTFDVAYILGGDTCGTIHYDKITIIHALIQFVKDNYCNEYQDKLDKMISIVDFNKYLENNYNEIYHISIEGNDYEIPIKRLFEVIDISEEEFDKLLNDIDVQTIDGIPKKYFIYAISKYISDNKLMKKYLLPDNIEKRYFDIISLQKIDIQALNKYLETKDTLYKQITINSDLKGKILEGMPSNLSDLEKAIYIYIRMCKIFTYDEEYYAVNQRGDKTYKHRDIKYVNQVTLENNKIVCFEFNIIYSKLLDELGIHFASDYKNMCGEAYGEGHSNLTFRCDKFLVIADSVESILLGDITRAKINEELIGLNCLNKNFKTKAEFKEIVNKIYQMINEQDKNSSYNNLDDLLRLYESETDQVKQVSFEERLSILINQVNSTKMVGIDSLSYVLHLRKLLFSLKEMKENIGVTIIRDKVIINQIENFTVSAIFYLNIDGNLKYFYYQPNKELNLISLEELQRNFDNQKFGYIELKDPRIPGVIDKKEIKR